MGKIWALCDFERKGDYKDKKTIVIIPLNVILDFSMRFFSWEEGVHDNEKRRKIWRQGVFLFL